MNSCPFSIFAQDKSFIFFTLLKIFFFYENVFKSFFKLNIFAFFSRRFQFYFICIFSKRLCLPTETIKPSNFFLKPSNPVTSPPALRRVHTLSRSSSLSSLNSSIVSVRRSSDLKQIQIVKLSEEGDEIYNCYETYIKNKTIKI